MDGVDKIQYNLSLKFSIDAQNSPTSVIKDISEILVIVKERATNLLLSVPHYGTNMIATSVIVSAKNILTIDRNDLHDYLIDSIENMTSFRVHEAVIGKDADGDYIFKVVDIVVEATTEYGDCIINIFFEG